MNRSSSANQLLFLSALPNQRNVDAESLRYLVSTVKDWNQLLGKACFHRLQPRLYSFLKRNGAQDFLEGPVWTKIESVYHQAQFQVMALEGELTQILLPAFNQSDIPILLLKGAALLQTVYRKKPIRFCVDLDLLIHPEDLSKAQLSLERLGYRLNRLSHFPSIWLEREIGSRRNREFTFIHPQKKLVIDLHTETHESSPILGSNWLWKGAVSVDLDGARAFLPQPNRHFILLVLHLARHTGRGGFSLGWLADLDECLHYFQKEIDVNFCGEAFRVSPCAGVVSEILALLDLYFDSPLSKQLHQIVQEKEAAPHLPTSIFSLEKSKWITRNDLLWEDQCENFLFYWGCISGFRKKLVFLWHWLFPDKEYLETKYPFRTFLNRMTAWVRHWCEMGFKGVGLALGLLGRYTNPRHDKETGQDPEEIDGQEARGGVGLSQSGERRVLRLERDGKPRLGSTEGEG